MWNPFRKAREREELLLQTLQLLSSQFTTALQHQSDTHLESVKTIAAANIEVAKGLGEQAKSFGNWIESFKVAAQPESRVMNDELEAHLEKQRRETLEKEGFPINGTRGDQMSAVMNRFLDIENLEKSILG